MSYYSKIKDAWKWIEIYIDNAEENEISARELWNALILAGHELSMKQTRLYAERVAAEKKKLIID